MEFDELSNRVIGHAIEVHRVLGPGLLESTYEQCLAYELGDELKTKTEKIFYQEIRKSGKEENKIFPDFLISK